MSQTQIIQLVGTRRVRERRAIIDKRTAPRRFSWSGALAAWKVLPGRRGPSYKWLEKSGDWRDADPMPRSTTGDDSAVAEANGDVTRSAGLVKDECSPGRGGRVG